MSAYEEIQRIQRELEQIENKAVNLQEDLEKVLKNMKNDQLAG